MSGLIGEIAMDGLVDLGISMNGQVIWKWPS